MQSIPTSTATSSGFRSLALALSSRNVISQYLSDALNSLNFESTLGRKSMPDTRLSHLPPSEKRRFQTKKLQKNKKINFQSENIVRIPNNFLSENVPRKFVKSFKNAGDCLIMDQNQVMWCGVKSYRNGPDVFVEKHFDT
jgi:hypothetical protein